MTASKASSSHSKTRAGPVKTWLSGVMPATFTIAPSGARLPIRPTTPPVFVIGVATAWMTFPSASPFTVSSISPMVLPCAVMHSSWIRPARRSSFITTGTPPAS